MEAGNIAAVPRQVTPPNRIQSVQLKKPGDPAAPPVIRLQTDDHLVLSFDEMSSHADFFTVKITYHNRDWSRSTLIPVDYLGGSGQDQISDVHPSTVQDPRYMHYSYTFPNRILKPVVSGNFMLHVYDSRTGEELFSLPFFVSENKNEVTTKTDLLYNQGPGSYRYHQLFTSYHYPDFVKFPQFNLHVTYTQNRFWGRTKDADVTNVSQKGVLEVHNSRDNLFIANYGFLELNLQSFSHPQYNVVEYRPGTIPPAVVLRTDTPALSTETKIRSYFKFGQIDNSPNAHYANVHFSLNASDILNADAQVYLLGSFNSWSIQPSGKMTYDRGSGLFKGAVEIKQGRYNYKYAVVEDGRVDDLRLDTHFASTRQEYVVFVYYHDQTRQIDRLLAENDFFTR